MWIRLRLDIAWRNLFAGVIYSILPASRSYQTKKTLDTWTSEKNCLITLSVRSAFDLMLRALKLPEGSEVMMTALTVPGMIRIVSEHGLIPVPVDIDETGEIIEGSFRCAISSNTKLFVVAHLFGNRCSITPYLSVLKENNILIAEDCAQSFEAVGEQGEPNSDFILHSFGPIKTCTALSGAICRAKSKKYLLEMKEILRNDPVNSRSKFLKRAFKFILLKTISGRIQFAILRKVLRILKIDFDRFLNNLGYSFSKDSFFRQIRQQPSTPLIRLLRRQWTDYDFNRIKKRKQLGKKLDSILDKKRTKESNYWIYPVFSANRIRLCEKLRSAGFDATTLSRLAIVPALENSDLQSPTTALKNWEKIVFLPWYPDLTNEALEKMGQIVTNDSSTSS